MVVDSPDKLILSDNREAMTPEREESSEEKDDLRDAGVYESTNVTQVIYLSVLVFFCSAE